MHTEYTYNPVARPSMIEALSEKLSDTFYGSAAGQFAIQLGFFIGGCAVIAVVAVAFTA